MNSTYASSWETAFDKVHEVRKPNADAIADLALENFEEVCFNESVSQPYVFYLETDYIAL